MVQSKSTLLFLPVLLLPLMSHSQTDETALKQFEHVVKTIEQSINESAEVIAEPRPGSSEWWRRKVTTQAVQFDVKRTDSIVTPLIGEALFSCDTQAVKAQTQEDAQTLPFNFSSKTACKAAYAYQDKKWVFKKMQCAYPTSNPSRSPSWYEVTSPSNGMTGRCLSLLPK